MTDLCIFSTEHDTEFSSIKTRASRLTDLKDFVVDVVNTF